MKNNQLAAKVFLICSPFIILIVGRIGVDLSITFFPKPLSWIPAFLGYYVAIVSVIEIARKTLGVPFQWKLNFKKDGLFFGFRPFPRMGLLLGSIVLPALIPLGAYMTYGHLVPSFYFLYILLFALINPIFEESFWRGLLYHLPFGNTFKILYSAAGFAFSHYFFWFYWLDLPHMLSATVISTFIMGVLWMYFLVRHKNHFYGYWSHVVVDILNLSIAIFSGVVAQSFL